VGLAACGDDGDDGVDSGTIDGAQVASTPLTFGDGNEIWLRVETGGGFVPLIVVQRQTPSILLFDDGRLVRSVGDPDDVVPTFESAQLDEAATAELLDEMAAVVDGPDVGSPPVTDLPTRTIEVTVDGETRSLDLYAPGFEDGLSPGQVDARHAVDDALADAAAVGDAEPYVPDEWLALTTFSGIEPGGMAPWPLAPRRMAGAGTDNVCTRLTRDEFDQVATALNDAGYRGYVVSDNGSAEIALRPVLTGDETCNLGEFDQFVER
jgi:hypothetical protein